MSFKFTSGVLSREL